MSYENAPATKLLATRCAVCARPLVDAVSVEAGIGPDCREKYGFNVEVDEAARADVNKIVYYIAAATNKVHAATLARCLAHYGFAKLGARILDRLVDIRIETIGDELRVETPFVDAATPTWRRIPGRRFVKGQGNFVPTTEKARLWILLQNFYAGAIGDGEKGIFQVVAAKK